MADISQLSRLEGSAQRNVDLSSNTLVLSSVKLGTSELTKSALDSLVKTTDSANPTDASAFHTHDSLYGSNYFEDGGFESSADLATVYKDLGQYRNGISGGFESDYSMTFVDASNQGLVVSPDASLEISDEISFFLWIKSTDTGLNYLVDANSVSVSGYFTIYVNSGTLYCTVYKNTGSLTIRERGFTSSSTALNGSWHHVGFTYNTSSGDLLLYLDGSDDSGSYTQTGTVDTLNSSSKTFSFASRSVFSGGYDGQMDELSFWSKALSSSEVTELYENGKLTEHSAYANLVSWWRMGDDDGGTGTTVTDTINGNDAAFKNTPTFTSDTPTIVQDTPSVLTATRNTTTPLSGSADLKISKSASDGTDEGVTLLSKTIDKKDRGRDLFFEAEIDATAANYTAGNLQLKAYDATNSAILDVYPLVNLDDNAGIYKINSKVIAKILPPSTCTQIRLSLHLETDSNTGSTWDVYVDDARLTTQSPMISAFAGEAVRYTTNSAQTLTDSAFTRIDYEDIDYDVNSRVTTGSSWTYTVPRDGKYRVTASLNIQNNTAWTIGEAGQLGLFIDGVEADVLDIYYPQASAVNVAVLLNGTATVDLTAGQEIDIRFFHGAGSSLTSSTSGTANFVEIVELDRPGNIVNGNDVPLQAMFAEAERNTNQSVSSAGSFTTIDLNNTVEDGYGMVDLTNDRITFPKDGLVHIEGSVQFASNGTGDRGVGLVYNNNIGSGDIEIARSFAAPTSSNDTSLEVDRTYRVIKGGYVDLNALQTSGGALNVTGRLAARYIPDYTNYGISAPDVRRVPIRTETAAYTATIGDETILCNSSAAAFTVTLPTAVGYTGKEFLIKKIGTDYNNITIDGAGSETIDGDTTYVLHLPREYVKIVSDGSNWQVVDEHWEFEGCTVTLTTSTTGQTAPLDVPFNEEQHDPHGSHSSGTFTAKAPGYYQVNAGVAFGSLDGSTNAHIILTRSGSGMLQAYASRYAANAVAPAYATASHTYFLNEGQTVTVYATGDASFDLDSASSRCYMSVARVSKR